MTQPPLLPPSPPPASPVPPPPQPAGGHPEAYTGPAVGKDRVVAIVLALLLGGLGIHKFYLGQVPLGILYLIFSWTGIPGIIAWVEAILYLRRSDESWAAQYGGPVRRTGGGVLGCLWALAILPILLFVVSMFAIVSLLFLGGQVSGVLEDVASQIPTTESATSAPAASASSGDIDRLLDAARAQPDDVDALFEVADAYYAAEDYTAAVAWLDRVLALEPGNERALLAKGAVAFNLGDFDAAEAAWPGVAAASPDNQEAHYDLGFLYLNLEQPNWDGVVREWTRVVEIDPTTELARTVQGHLDSLVASSMLPASPTP